MTVCAPSERSGERETRRKSLIIRKLSGNFSGQFSVSKKSSNGWAFLRLYDKMVLGDERCWNDMGQVYRFAVVPFAILVIVQLVTLMCTIFETGAIRRKT